MYSEENKILLFFSPLKSHVFQHIVMLKQQFMVQIQYVTINFLLGPAIIGADEFDLSCYSSYHL